MANNKKNQNLLFWGITLLFPVILLLLVEGALRISGYKSNTADLFMEVPTLPEYKIVNPEFVGRYFPNFVPQLAPNPFKEKKPENTYRIFVFGGSSTQGFPYNFYESFSAKLEQRLLLETNGLNIEVINLGMTAVNSYVVWDLSSRVMEYEPDAVIIYAGHNEYYGSFGVGSSQFGLGKNIGLKRLIIKLKNFALYRLLEDLMKPEKSETESRTMMARVVSESEIELGGDTYQAGLRQFRENIGDVISNFKEEGIPVYIGNLASNLKDQAPLGDNEEARLEFERGIALYDAGEIDSALTAFEKSKDLDDTRFRAPSAINDIIYEFSDKYDATLVDVRKLSIDSSRSHIPDNSFFDDHLHPNWRGHQMIADVFFNSLVKNDPVLKKYYLPNELFEWHSISHFEDTFSKIPIARLTAGYPFSKGLTADQEYRNFQNIFNSYLRKSYVDSLAAVTWRYNKPTVLSLTDALNDYHKKEDTVAVVKHYLDLGYWQLFNESLLKKGVSYSINNRNLDSYNALFLHIINSKDREDAFFSNSLSAIYLLHQDLDRASVWLKKSEELDPESKELLYNYARYYVMSGDTLQAREYYQRYMNQVRQN